MKGSREDVECLHAPLGNGELPNLIQKVNGIRNALKGFLDQYEGVTDDHFVIARAMEHLRINDPPSHFTDQVDLVADKLQLYPK